MVGQLEMGAMIAAVLLQLGAAWFSYAVYKFNRLGSGWFSVTAALYFMAAGGVLNLAVQMGTVEKTQLTTELQALWIPLAVSVFLFLGVYAMAKSFQSFDVVESQTKAKIDAFNKRK